MASTTNRDDYKKALLTKSNPTKEELKRIEIIQLEDKLQSYAIEFENMEAHDILVYNFLKTIIHDIAYSKFLENYRLEHPDFDQDKLDEDEEIIGNNKMYRRFILNQVMISKGYLYKFKNTDEKNILNDFEEKINTFLDNPPQDIKNILQEFNTELVCIANDPLKFDEILCKMSSIVSEKLLDDNDSREIIQTLKNMKLNNDMVRDLLSEAKKFNIKDLKKEITPLFNLDDAFGGLMDPHGFCEDYAVKVKYFTIADPVKNYLAGLLEIYQEKGGNMRNITNQNSCTIL
jgi:hypothetical protein